MLSYLTIRVSMLGRGYLTIRVSMLRRMDAAP